MFELHVGQPYHPEFIGVPDGVHVLGLGAERLEVIVVLSDPTPAEVEAFRTAPLEVGLATHQELIVLLLRIRGALNGWSDATFDIRRAPAGERTPPSLGQSAVTWLLLDQRGIIQVIRLATLTRRFMGTLREKVEAQLREPFRQERLDRLVHEYQARYSPDALVHRAWVVEVAGTSEPHDVGPVAEVAAEARTELADLIADDRVREVVAEAIARGEAHVEEREGVWWYVDPHFGPDLPLAELGYDETLGLVDRRRFGGPGA